MGVVYEAVQLSLGRRVALKVMRPEFARDAAFVRRFRREGQLQASLEHPNVLDVYEVGESDGGLFLAMRLVEGRPLSELIAERELAVGRALALLEQVAAALDAAHAIGLVHGDVKPENVLVDGDDTAYLADFGLTTADNGSIATGSRRLLGTVSYVSPEVISGEAPGPASDRYSLAATAFHALTGEPVFPKGAPAAVLYAHASEPAPAISRRRGDLPAALDPLFARALAKDPDERPTSGRELIALITSALGEKRLASLGPPASRPLRAPVAQTLETAAPVSPARRRPVAALVAVALAAAALGAGVAALIDDGDSAGGEAVAAAPPRIPEGAVPLGSELGAVEESVGCRGKTPRPLERACAIVQTALPGSQLLVPANGVIVGWGVSGAHGELALDVIRPGGTETKRVGRSQFESAANDAPSYFGTKLPVERGDLIGIEVGRGASIGVGNADGATTERWISPRGGAFGLPDRGEGTGFDRELLLRADLVPGGEVPVPRQLTGRRAVTAPPGQELDRDRMRIFEPRLKVEVALVELDNRVVLDLFSGARRAARIYLPGLLPNGLPYDLKAIDYPGEGYGEADVWWVNPKSGRLQFHHLLVYPGRFEFIG